MPVIISLNVGLPRDVTWKGKTITTGIFKAPVPGPVRVANHNLEGDGQADLSVHGGPTKAIYVYPMQHYDYWRDALEDGDLGWGAFGENLTVDGVDEETINIGDEYRVGSARVVVTEPRMPCSKLAVRFGRADMVKKFLKSQRTGFYFGILEEGVIQVGDHLELLARHAAGLGVADVTRLYTTERGNERLLSKAIAVDALPASWRDYFIHQRDKLLR